MIERFFIFAKAQISSFFGGIVDYLVMILCTELFHVYYPYSVAIGGVVGAMVNFSINKKWAFRSKTLPYQYPLWRQVFRFCLVVINSILLKASGTYFFTAYMGIDYKISRIMTDLIVSWLFNYTLQRFWVFKRVQ
jgi:putative flippase GtrA